MEKHRTKYIKQAYMHMYAHILAKVYFRVMCSTIYNELISIK